MRRQPQTGVAWLAGLVIKRGLFRAYERPSEEVIDEKPQRQGSPAEGNGSNGQKTGVGLWVQATRYSYLGLFFGCAVFIGYAGGAWLDRRFHTAPWLMMVGVLLGIAAGFKELLRLAGNYRRDQTKTP